jgi:hypothetical protein
VERGALTLMATIESVLAEGGPRKPAILRSMARAKKLERHFDAVIDVMRSTGKLKIMRRNGGAHYALASS